MVKQTAAGGGGGIHQMMETDIEAGGTNQRTRVRLCDLRALPELKRAAAPCHRTDVEEIDIEAAHRGRDADPADVHRDISGDTVGVREGYWRAGQAHVRGTGLTQKTQEITHRDTYGDTPGDTLGNWRAGQVHVGVACLADVLRRDGTVRAACAAVAAEFLLDAAGSGGDRCACYGDTNEPNQPLPMLPAYLQNIPLDDVAMDVLELLCWSIDGDAACLAHSHKLPYSHQHQDSHELVHSHELAHSHKLPSSSSSLSRLLLLNEHEHVLNDGSRFVHSHGRLSVANGGWHMHPMDFVKKDVTGMGHEHVTEDGSVVFHEHEVTNAECACGFHNHPHITQPSAGGRHAHSLQDGTVLVHAHDLPAYGAARHAHDAGTQANVLKSQPYRDFI